MTALTYIAAANTLDELLREGVQKMEAGQVRPLVVSVGNFSYGDKNIGSGFSRYLIEKLELLLQGSGKFQLFEKEKLEAILEGIEFSLSDLVDPGSAVQVGKLKGVQALLSGRFFDEGDKVRVFLEIVSIETGLLLLKEELVIPRSEIPQSISISPDNYNDALFILDELYEVHGAHSQDFAVKLWTTRGNGATYQTGENLIIHFFASMDCYIKVYQIDVHKRTQLIFPNPFFSDNYIQGGKIYRIPDSHYPFDFILSEPLGTEFIKVIASTVPFEDMEESFEDIGEARGSLLTRGLKIEKKDEMVAEALISYTIVD